MKAKFDVDLADCRSERVEDLFFTYFPPVHYVAAGRVWEATAGEMQHAMRTNLDFVQRQFYAFTRIEHVLVVKSDTNKGAVRNRSGLYIIYRCSCC